LVRRKKPSKKALLELRSKIALEHIITYFKLALEFSRKGDIKKADYCIRKIRWISKNFGVKIPRPIKYFICRKCKKFMLPSKLRVRVRDNREPHLSIRCPRCGAIRRIYFKRKRK